MAGTHAFAQQQEQQHDWSIGVGAEYSDNISRSAADEQSDTMVELDVRAAIARQTARLQSTLSADGAYREYLQDTYDSEFIGGVYGLAQLAIVPQRLVWAVEDNFSQIDVDQLAAETPDNRQNLNYFTTGPNLIFAIGSRMRLDLHGRWSDVDYETSPFDNRRYLGGVSLERTVGPTTLLSLNATHQAVEFDDNTFTSDYDTQQYFLRWSSEASRSTLTADMGYTTVRGFGGTSDGMIARAGFTRRVGARSLFTLNLGTEFSDSAEILRRSQSTRGIVRSNEDALAAADPLRADYADAALRLDGRRIAIVTRVRWRKESHELQTLLDRKRLSGELSVSRRVSPRTTVQLRTGYEKEDFSVLETEVNDWWAGGGISWRLVRGIQVRLDYTHFVGSGDIFARDYDENRVAFRVAYSPL